MKNTTRNITLGTAVLALIFATSTQANADDGVKPYQVEAPVENLVTTGGGIDTVTETGEAARRGVLECVPGKATYNIGYRGLLDMSNVKNKWFELRDFGVNEGWRRFGAYGRLLGMTGPADLKAMIFDALNVSSEFTISYTLSNPEKVTVNIDDQSTPEELAAFKAHYEAQNAEGAAEFAKLMTPLSGWRYDGKGTFSIDFRLRTTAGELDKAFEAMTKGLTIDTLPGDITVTKAQLQNLDEKSTEGHVEAISEGNPSVTGTFDAVSDFFIAADRINAVMHTPNTNPGYLPIEFGQAPDASTQITVHTDATSLRSYVSVTPGKDLPQDVYRTNSDPEATDLSVAEASATPEAPSDVEVADGKWHFTGWKSEPISWNDDPTLSADCKVARHIGSWEFIAKADSMTPENGKVTPSADPSYPGPSSQSQDKVIPPAKKSLANTGMNAVIFGALAGLMTVTGIAALRRRYKA